MKLEKRLQQGLHEMGLELPPPAVEKLLNAPQRTEGKVLKE